MFGIGLAQGPRPRRHKKYDAWVATRALWQLRPGLRVTVRRSGRSSKRD